MESKMKDFYEEKLPFTRIHHEYMIKQMEIAEARVRILLANRALVKYETEEVPGVPNKEEDSDGNTNK